MEIPTLHERARGCGFRKPGGLYFRADGRGRARGLLPILLENCPCCGAGIKFSRGWTWVDVAKLASMNPTPCAAVCGECPLADAKIEKAGLLWIGEKFYKTPEDWMREADAMGISRRINTVPRDFKLGETWVALAHISAIPGDATKGEEAKAGIFRLFQPTAIEYVTKGDETAEELDAFAKRGITPVNVVPVHDQPELGDQ